MISCRLKEENFELKSRLTELESLVPKLRIDAQEARVLRAENSTLSARLKQQNMAIQR